jgi:EmrB/QacA subfamily drug resistance transporter
MAEKHVSAHEHASAFTDKQKKIALVVVATAFVMDLLDSTIVNIGIPSIQSNLGASYASIQWLIAGYLLAFATLLVTGGRMGDVFGYKKLFMVGVAGFTVASLLSGLAWSPEILIATRVLQGAMAALMVPQVTSMMQIMYKPSERGAINGLFGALGGLSASLGPVIGGLLIQANIFGLDWRPIFLINVPVGIVALILAVKYLPNGKSPHPLRLDVVGTVLLVATLTLLIYPLIQGRELDWPTWSFVLMVAAAPMLAIFIWWQRFKDKKDGSALIPPSLFHHRSVGYGLAVNLTFEAAMLGYFLTFGLFTQIGLGFTPIHAALTGLPLAVGITFSMIAFGQTLIPKLGRKAIIFGASMMATGIGITTWVFFQNGIDTNSFQLIPGQLIMGIGMGWVFGALYAAVLNGVDTKHAGAASGTLNAVQQIGGSIGIAVIGVVFFGALTSGAATHFDTIVPKLQDKLTSQHIPAAAQTAIIEGAKTCFVDRSHQKDSTVVPASCQLHDSAPVNQELVDIITTSAKEANEVNFAHAFRWAFIYELGFLALTVGISFLLPKKFNKDAYEG